jgi:superfamily II DNA or RNA helicase
VLLSAKTSLVMRGEVGIPRNDLDPFSLDLLQKQLTRVPTGYDGPGKPVCALRDDDPDYVWIPRYFQPDVFWPMIESWDWAVGQPHPFQRIAKLDPERGQDTAVPAMIAHLQQHRSGVLVAPTGTGKTLMGYSIAANFNLSIGVPVFVGHMSDNWIKHAKTVLGLRDDQIGIVQGDRCDLGRPVTIMSVQSLISRRYPDALYEQIGFLLCDEVHRFGANVWKTIVAQFPATYRLGLSANPNRKDALGDFIEWSFGKVGHRAKRVRPEAAAAPTVFVMKTDRNYSYEGYCNWVKAAGGWEQGDPHAIKYDKLLAVDPVRNALIATEIVKAISKDRAILVLSSLTAHLATLRAMVFTLLEHKVHPLARIVRNEPYPDDHRFIRLDTLEAGLKPAERGRVGEADVIFATYAMAREALDVPKLDTAFFCTPTGDPLQPVGRLREKIEWLDRKPLMIVDVAEAPPYSQNKLKKRISAYRGLGLKVIEVTRRTT